MKKIVPVLLLITVLLCMQYGYSQSKLSIDNIASIYLRNSGPVIADAEIKGYFLFYQTDKVDRKTNEYTLQILDDNLNKVKSIEFADSKNLSLLESSYNGSDIMFLFFNSDKNLLEYRVYGVDGSEKFNFQHEINNKTKKWLEQYRAFSTEESQNKNLYSIEKRGFVTVIPTMEGTKTDFEIHYYQTTSKKQWTYHPEGRYLGANALYLGATDNVAIFAVMKAEVLFTGKMTTSILGLDIGTGEQLFDFETSRDRYNFFPMNIATLPNSREFMLMGLYFDKKDKMYSKNLGLGIWIMDENGKKLFSKYNSWEEDISRHLKASKTKLDQLGDIYFHDILQTADGKIFAVGEGFKQSNNTIKVTDMVMFEFDKQFNIASASIYGKNENKLKVPIALGSGFLTASMVKGYGGFDYSYLQTDKRHTMFSFGYTDQVKGKKSKALTFNAVSYYNNNITTDKIDLNTESGTMRILPSKTGSVLIMEYFKKEKRLDMRMEKIN